MDFEFATCQLCSKVDFENALKGIDKKIVGQSYLTHLNKTVDMFYEKQWSKCWENCDMLIDITWEKLNTGYWKDIHLSWRHAYTFISMTKAFCEFHQITLKNDGQFQFHDAVKTCDMGLLMGAPLLNNILSRMIEPAHY